MRAHLWIPISLLIAVCAPAVAGEVETRFTLGRLQALARSVHPTLRSAEAAIEAAAGARRQAGAFANPEISVAWGRGRPRDGGDSRSETNIQLVQPLEFSGVRRWRNREAELLFRSAEIDRHRIEAVIDSTVARFVYSMLFEERRLQIARESAAIASRLRQLLERRAELGESSPLAAVKARSEEFSRRREVLDAERSLASARGAIEAFFAGELPKGFSLAGTLEGSGANPLPDDLFDRLRSDNPTAHRAELAIEQAAAVTESTKKASFPRLDLMASHEKELDRTATLIGVGMTIPLWNRNRGATAAAAAVQSRAVAESRALTVEFDTALAQATAAYRGHLAEIRLFEEGWTETAKRSLEISTFSFENGEASLLDVLDAQRFYLNVSLAEAEAWAALSLARVEIERLIAGPLDPETPHETR